MDARSGRDEQHPHERVVHEVFGLAPPARDGEGGAEQILVAFEEQVLERIRPL